MRPVTEVQTKEDLHGIIAAKDAEIAELKRVAGDWAKAYAYVTEQDRHRVDVLRGQAEKLREMLTKPLDSGD